jgi:hypothetical protein
MATKQRLFTGEIVCNILIESGLVLLLLSVIIANVSISFRQSLIILPTLIFLSLIFITNNLKLLQTSLGRIGFPLIFMFVFSLVNGNEVKPSVAEDRILFIPLAIIFLFIATLAWIAKSFIKKELKISKNEVLVSFLCAAGLLIFLGLGLYVPLSIIHQIDPNNLINILKRVLQYTILFMIVITYINTQRQAKRILFYVVGVFGFLLILKGISSV